MKRAETRPPGPPRQGGGKRQVSIKYYLLQVQIINIVIQVCMERLV